MEKNIIIKKRAEWTDNLEDAVENNKYINLDCSLDLRLYKKIAQEDKHLLKKYLDRISNTGLGLDPKFFNELPSDLKSHYIDKRIDAGSSLYREEFKFSTPEQVKKYVDIAIKNKHGLPNNQFKVLSIEQKEKIIKNKDLDKYFLSKEEFNFISDDVFKQYYIIGYMKKGYPIYRHELEWGIKKMPEKIFKPMKKHIESIIKMHEKFNKSYPDDLYLYKFEYDWFKKNIPKTFNLYKGKIKIDYNNHEAIGDNQY